ncbi:MAG: DNA-formamidopyrimidine glycosylase family protein [Candidatus Dormiibacterota bacterium]
MPELPEVEALVRLLDSRTRQRRVLRVELGSFAALKTVQPSITELLGRQIQGWQRRGKYLCLDADQLWMVVHLGRAGWVRWYQTLPATRIRPGRSPIELRLGLEVREGEKDSPGLDLTEAGREKRLSIWVVNDPIQIPAVANLGPDPLDPALTSERLGELLAKAPGTIKSALSNQTMLAGVGNAYSDEVLHAARLSPFKSARSLSTRELDVLHAALVETLRAAVGLAVALDADQLKDAKRSAMQVHGRAGEVCPTCGDTVREVAYASRSLQYCPTCQTGGKALADRRLSRLLR